MRVTKWGNSLAIRIPRAVAEQAALQEGTEVDLTVEGEVIAIRHRRAGYQLDGLLRSITPDNQHEETEWGEPQGREVW